MASDSGLLEKVCLALMRAGVKNTEDIMAILKSLGLVEEDEPKETQEHDYSSEYDNNYNYDYDYDYDYNWDDYEDEYEPTRILKSGDRTIVFWGDGDKTVVKRAADEQDNDYTAFCAALAKKVFGSNNAIKKAIERTLEYQEDKKKHDKH